MVSPPAEHEVAQLRHVPAVAVPRVQAPARVPPQVPLPRRHQGARVAIAPRQNPHTNGGPRTAVTPPMVPTALDLTTGARATVALEIPLSPRQRRLGVRLPSHPLRQRPLRLPTVAAIVAGIDDLDPRPAPKRRDRPALVGLGASAIGPTGPPPKHGQPTAPVGLAPDDVARIPAEVIGGGRAVPHLRRPGLLRVANLVPRPVPRGPHLAALPRLALPTVPVNVLGEVAVHALPIGVRAIPRAAVPPVPAAVGRAPEHPAIAGAVSVVRAVDLDLHAQVRLIRRTPPALVGHRVALNPAKIHALDPRPPMALGVTALAVGLVAPPNEERAVIATRMRRTAQTARVHAMRLLKAVGPALPRVPAVADRQRPAGLHVLAHLARLAVALAFDAPVAAALAVLRVHGVPPRLPRLPPEVDVALRHARGTTTARRVVPVAIEVPIGAGRRVRHAVPPGPYGRRPRPIGPLVPAVPTAQTTPGPLLAAKGPLDLDA